MRPLPLFAALLLASPALAAPPAYDDATLRAVRFVDRNEGWAVGDIGVIWHTIDAGKTWERQPSGTRASLRAVQFLTPYTGFVVGRVELPNAAGSQGVILKTTNGGVTWREVTSALLPGLSDCNFFDENKGVVTGACTDAFPNGSFETTDGGRSWTPLTGRQAAPSERFRKPGCPLPLTAQQMLGEQTGWAVGELGMILGTTDSGKTWKLLKAGGQKAAVLFVHARPESVPLGAVAQLGAKDGYLCAAVTLSGEEPRLSAAMRACGGAAGVVDQSRTWPGYRNESPAKTERDPALLTRLVLAIRTWRPEVIVTDKLSPDAPHSDQIMLTHLREAFEKAADPKAFPEQFEQFGLAPHTAKKLYALAPSDKASVTLDLTAFVPELGDAIKDFTEPAAMLLGTTNPNTLRFQLVAHRLPGAEKHTALMDGIHLAEGGTARRRKSALPAATILAERKNAAKLRRQLETLLANPAVVGGMEKALAQTIGTLGTLSPDIAARAAVSLGFRLAKAGQWTAARELFALVAEKYPAHPDAIEAVRWLVRYQTSGEVRRRIELGHFPVFQKAAFVAADPGVVQASASDGPRLKPVYQFSNLEALRQWNQAAGLDLEPKLAAFGTGYARDPGNNFCLLAARRNLGLYADATKQLHHLLPAGELTGGDGWRYRLADELKLVSNAESKLTPRAGCRFTASRPFLDGKLDDECWQSAEILPVKSATNSATEKGYTTRARFAFDDKFLYVAVTCNHPEGKQVPQAEKRGRDAELHGHDRVEILLDLDRDYQTYYRLRMDHRGCVAEDCWGDVNWNPRWFVAVEPTATGWTAEAAIPLAELTGTPPTAGQTWGMNVVRIVPGIGVDSWGGLSDATPQPAAMGLMHFIGGAPPKK